MTPALNPTATKPIPPKPEAKLGEASRYLMGMEVTRESYEDFRWLVANFLTATRSVPRLRFDRVQPFATGRSCRIQVKSRWASDYDRTFPLKKDSSCDFVVFAELNRGYRGYRHKLRRAIWDLSLRGCSYFRLSSSTPWCRSRAAGPRSR